MAERVNRGVRRSERGAALILVTFVMMVILVGGLAAVAVSSGALSSSRGFRVREVSDACAAAGLEKARSLLPDTAAAGSYSAIGVGSTGMSYAAGHYSTAGVNGDASVRTLDASAYDASALFAGENITNSLGPGGGGANGLQVMALTAVCSGSGVGQREDEMIFRYGSTVGAR